MLNPWVLIGVAVIWGLSLVAVGSKANRIGHESERVVWLAKANTELVAANALVTKLQQEMRDLEARRVEGMAILAREYLQEKTANDERAKRDAAAARTGALVLRIPAAALCPDSGFTGPPRPAAAGGDGAETVELPQQITGDLLALANDADSVADQLRACQQVVANDRKESP